MLKGLQFCVIVCSLITVSARADISATTQPAELNDYFNTWQNQVGAAKAYGMGARGKGVVVAVLDTGVGLQHLAFKERLLPGFSAIPDKLTAQDDNGHGSSVAGIIGSSADGKMTVGIAPDVSLIPIKVLNAAGNGSEAQLLAGMQYAVANKTMISNVSIGSVASALGANAVAMQLGVKSGQLIVVAAGNSGASDPVYPAHYASYPQANGQIIAVGAVDEKNVMPAWSNKAGDAKEHYLVAPGVGIVSTSTNGGYGVFSGTSYAAPVVSGAAADVWSRWTYLTAPQVAKILLTTATHLGSTPANVPDPVYGMGLVNLNKALQPVGAPKIATYNSSYYALGPSVLSTNSLISASKFSGMTVSATDDFGRGFSYDVKNFVSVPQPMDLSAMFVSMDKQMSMVRRKTATSNLLALSFGALNTTQNLGNPFADTSPATATLGGFNFTQKFNCTDNQCRTEFAAGANGFADKYFGLSAEFVNLPVVSNFANPYFQFAGSSSHIAAGYATDDGYKMKLGFLTPVNPLANQTPWSINSSSNGWIGEVSKSFSNATAAVTVGAVGESNSLLGATGSSAFGVRNAHTRFVTVSGSYAITSKTTLLAQASMGLTKGGGETILLDSNIKTTSWSMGVIRSDLVKNGDQVALVVSQPMKVVSGAMNLALPTVDSSTGQTGFNFSSVNMASGHAEIDLELGYMSPLTKTANLRINAAYKQNVNNDVGTVRVLGIRYQATF